MGATIALLTGKGIEATEELESIIRVRRNNLLMVITICMIIFIAISTKYMSYGWLWLVIPIFVISLGLLIPIQTAYWNLITYTIPGKFVAEAVKTTAEVAPTLIT